ncbi:MAG: NifB/NifX family molybdenum-iron cluster-binding protein [Candidatus Bathyarchaeota archaeon]|nr:NifB/NifX family molybdenum-iron cluster-binding protein [Candidatus Bathyarchaeota archaeon]
MTRLRIAVATKGREGLGDSVSEVFGRANNFTIIDVQEGAIKNVKVLENPAVSYQHGAGPIVVKMLIDLNVNLVIAPEFGPGASTLLEQHNIEKASMKAGTVVSEAVRKTLSQQKSS